MDELVNKKRYNYVKELSEFINNCEEELKAIVSNLGWSLESLDENSEESIVCPFYSSHRVPVKSLEEHLKKCQWKAEGYSYFDKPFSEPQSRLNDESSITIGEDLQSKILTEARQENAALNIGVGEQLIPRTSDRLFSDFTMDERRILYEYVIAHTKKPQIGRDIMDLQDIKKKEDESNKISFLEQAAQERNLKRRRIRHRGVHTNKKSHTEILREVIDQQMEMYSEYIEQNNKDRKLKKQSPHDCRQDKIKKSEYYDGEEKLRSFVKDDEKYDEKSRKMVFKTKHRHRSRSKSRSRPKLKVRSRSRSRSRSKHRKKDRHRSRDRHEKKRKRSKSRSKKVKHKSRKINTEQKLK